MKHNLVIPCSGPGSRSSNYSKFHKSLIRIGNKAVINHIIDSYPDVDTVYIMLGHNSDYVKQYIEHCQYENVKFIDIDNWQESQFSSLRQLPDYVFENPFYLNSCDNWSTRMPTVTENTVFFCNPTNLEYYDTVNGEAFAGIGYVKDTIEWKKALESLSETRNDYLIYSELEKLNHFKLQDWYDVGNTESYNLTNSIFKKDFTMLDKTHQEVYYTNNRIIKLFNSNTDNLVDSLTKNETFPHPEGILFTDNALSYDFVDGKTNVTGEDFENLFNNLQLLWSYYLNNNKKVKANDIWQSKTYERFDKMIKKYPEFNKPICVNNEIIDPIRVIESIDWDTINYGIAGQCHGDLNLDNIIVGEDSIHYIDHRPGKVIDIFYDICKFYHSLYLNNDNIQNFSYENNENNYRIDINLNSKDRLEKFYNSSIYKKYRNKIELGVGCIWLSMAPLNVSDELNKFLFLYAIKHLNGLKNE